MNPYQVSHDSMWHRWVDGVVILVIGVALGIVIAQFIGFYQETTTTTETIRRIQTAPQVESGIQTDVPSGVKVEEG